MKVFHPYLFLSFLLISFTAHAKAKCYLLEPPLPGDLKLNEGRVVAGGAPVLCIQEVTSIEYKIGLGRITQYGIKFDHVYKGTNATDEPSSYLIEGSESQSTPLLLKRVTFYLTPGAPFGAIRLITPAPSSANESIRTLRLDENEHIYSYRELHHSKVPDLFSYHREAFDLFSDLNKDVYTPLRRMSWKEFLLSDDHVLKEFLLSDAHLLETSSLPRNIWLDFIFQNVDPELIAKANNEFHISEVISEVISGDDPNMNILYSSGIVRYHNYGIYKATLYLGQILDLKKSNRRLFENLFGHPSTQVFWNYKRIAPK